MAKTIKVSEVLQDINKKLALTEEVNIEHRWGLISALEAILHSTGNYSGFQYLSIEEVPTGELPGINVDEKGEYLENYEARFLNTDPTRRKYF